MSTRIKHLAVGVSAVLVAAVLPLAANTSSVAGTLVTTESASVPELVTSAPAGAARAAVVPASDRHSRARMVGFNGRALSEAKVGSRLGISFFEDASYVARVDRTDSSNLYDSWTGRLEGVGLGTFAAVRVGDVYRAIAISPEGTYVISNAGGEGVYRSSEVAPEREPAGSDQVTAADVPAMEKVEAKSVPAPAAEVSYEGTGERTLAAVEPAAKARKVTNTAQRKDSRAQADIGFVLSPQMIATVGGIDNANAYAALAVALNNQANVNSGISTSWRLVGTMVGPNEVGNFQGDLMKMSKHKGKYRKIKKWRNRVHADAVSNLIAGNGSYCGIAWLDVNDSKPFYKKPYSIVSYDCVDYMTTSHEVGHNYGAAHDPYALNSDPVGKGKPAYKYGRALVSVPGRWFTITAYFSECEANGVVCNKIAYFSNPNVAYGPYATGAKTQYNAKVINKKAKRMARFNLGQLYPAKVKLKGKPKAGKKVRIVTKRKKWNPTPKKLRYRWVVNGSYVPGKKGKKVKLKLKKAWKGLPVYGVVIGKKKTYTPVTVATKVKVIK